MCWVLFVSERILDRYSAKIPKCTYAKELSPHLSRKMSLPGAVTSPRCLRVTVTYFRKENNALSTQKY
jgi:hypothetical protein